MRVPFNITMGGKEVELSLQVKYLGVTLDSELSWKRTSTIKSRNAKL